MKDILFKVMLTALLFLLWNSPILKADNEVINSLKSRLIQSENETEQIDIINQLSYEYYQIDIEKTFSYGQEALTKAKAINYQKGIAQALKYLAIGHRVQKDISKSIELNEEALGIARQIGDKKLIAQILNGLGLDYQGIGLTEKSIGLYLESLDYSIVSQDDKMECFTYRNLGFLYDKLDNQEKAIEYFNKGAQVARNSEHHMIKYIADLTSGDIYKRQKKYSQALEYFEKAFDLTTNNFSKATVLTEISSVYQLQKQWNEAVNYLNEAIKIIEISGNKEQLEESQLSLASLQFKKRDFQACLTTLKKMLASSIDKKSYSFNDKKLYKLLADTYQALENPQKAATYYQKLSIVQDSVYNRDKLDLTLSLEARYEIKEKEKENTFLKAQQEQNETILNQRKKTTFFSILTTVLVSIVALLLFNAYRNNQEFNKTLQMQVDRQTTALQDTNNQLKTSNIELERFVYIASHDLKEPLRNISGFSGLLERKIDDENAKSEIREYLHFIKSNAYQMNELIKNLLEYSRVDYSSKVPAKETSLEEMVDQVKQLIITDIQERNTKIIIIQNSPKFETITSQLFLVFKNLISNGLKYNKSELKIIKLSYQDQGKFHQFSVKDNGIGIDLQYKDQIFDMFKRLHNRAEYLGTGLGLAICKKIVANLGGRIWFESSSNGSEFFFTIAKKLKQ